MKQTQQNDLPSASVQSTSVFDTTIPKEIMNLFIKNQQKIDYSYMQLN